MYEASSPVEDRQVPVANRTGPHLTFFYPTSICADRFFRTQADPGTWGLGLAQPATVSGVRLHEPILRLKDQPGESVSETIPVDLLVYRPGPGGFSRSAGFPGRGYFPAHKITAVLTPDTVSALERDRHPHSHDRVPARRRSASPPGGDPVPAARSRPFPAGDPEPRHLPRPAAATGGASPL